MAGVENDTICIHRGAAGEGFCMDVPLLESPKRLSDRQLENIFTI